MTSNTRLIAAALFISQITALPCRRDHHYFSLLKYLSKSNHYFHPSAFVYDQLILIMMLARDYSGSKSAQPFWIKKYLAHQLQGIVAQPVGWSPLL